MPWLRIDDGFTEHEKVEGLSDRAFRLHVHALCLCARLLTDGRVSDTNLGKLAAALHTRDVTRYVAELVGARLWSAHNRGGYKIKDYLDYNPSSIKVKEQRERNASRQRDSRAKRHAVTNTVTNAVTNAVSHAGSHTAPSPSTTYRKKDHYVGPEDVTSEEDVENARKVADLTARIGRQMPS